MGHPLRSTLRAFSLIELMMVVLIIGLLSSVAIIRIGYGNVGRPGMRAVSRRLALDLRYARSLAITTGVNHYVQFSPTGYTTYRRENPKDVVVDASRTWPRGMRSFVSTQTFEFDPSGQARRTYWCYLYTPPTLYRIIVIMATGTATVDKIW